MRWQKSLWFKVVLVICCCVLFFVLQSLFYLNRQEEQEFIREIKETTAENNEGSEDDGAEQSTEASESSPADEVENSEKEQTPDKKQQDVSSANDVKQQDAPSADALEEVQGISFRGDSFCEEEDIPEKGLGACMKQILEQNDKEVPVEDYTMYEAGSMSHMKLAGVALEEIDSFLEKHKELANEQTLRVTDIKIRELTGEQMIRTDQGYIPVIFVGYYGGWVGDLEELCEQQQKILDTYQQKEKYLILGFKPSGFSDESLYRDTMTEYWGEHFLYVSDLQHSLSSDEGKAEAAQLVYDRLVELDYL